MLCALHITEEVGFSLPPEVSAVNREIYLHLKPRVALITSEDLTTMGSLSPSSDAMHGIAEYRRVTSAVMIDSFSRWSELPMTHMEELIVHCVQKELPLLQPAILQPHQLERLILICAEDTGRIPAFLSQIQAKSLEIDIPGTLPCAVLDRLVCSLKADTVIVNCAEQEVDFAGTSPYLRTIVMIDANIQLPLVVSAHIQTLELRNMELSFIGTGTTKKPSIVLPKRLKKFIIEGGDPYLCELILDLPESLEHLQLEPDGLFHFLVKVLPSQLKTFVAPDLNMRDMKLPSSLNSLHCSQDLNREALRSLTNLCELRIEDIHHSTLSAADLPSGLRSLRCGTVTEAEALPRLLRKLDVVHLKTAQLKVNLPAGILQMRLACWDSDLSPLPLTLDNLYLGSTCGTHEHLLSPASYEDRRYLGQLPPRLRKMIIDDVPDCAEKNCKHCIFQGDLGPLPASLKDLVLRAHYRQPLSSQPLRLEILETDKLYRHRLSESRRGCELGSISL